MLGFEMQISIPFGSRDISLSLDQPEGHVVVARPEAGPPPRGWADIVGDALPDPMGVGRIRDAGLGGKRVAVITDDWGRPTPAHEVMPLIVNELRAAGAADADITFITASGMHDPMTRAELARKLGTDVVDRFRCVSHDGGDIGELAFVGITRQGTPIWVNRDVSEADYVVALGRIYPHESHGYEGGYKMILPGVSGFDTIVRDHAFNFSPDSIVGVMDNPSRAETDAVGKMVGIDLLVNVVVDGAGNAMKAYCGEPEAVHNAGVEYGDRHIWGAEVGELADITITSPGSGPEPDGYHLETLYRAAMVTRQGGTVICCTARPMEIDAAEPSGIASDDVLAMGEADFGRVLPTLSLSEVLRLHERRRWPLDERTVQWRIKSARGEFYRRRKLAAVLQRNVVLTPDIGGALASAVSDDGDEVRVVVIPEGSTTLPKASLFRA